VQLPGHEILNDVRTGKLQVVLTDFVSMERSIYICFPHRDYHRAHAGVRRFCGGKLLDHPDIIAELPRCRPVAKREELRQSIL
jgi:hypothetical protein